LIIEPLLQQSLQDLAFHAGEMFGARRSQGVIDRHDDFDIFGIKDDLVQRTEARGLRDLCGEAEPLQDRIGPRE
jgi:hypothetical protein